MLRATSPGDTIGSKFSLKLLTSASHTNIYTKDDNLATALKVDSGLGVRTALFLSSILAERSLKLTDLEGV